MSYAITYDDIQRHLARYLGYEPANLNTLQRQDIKDAIEAGYRRWLDPPAIENGPSHRWSFLQGLGDLSLAIDQFEYDAPADFGTLLGTMTYNDATLYKQQITQISENRFRVLKSREAYETLRYPRHVAIRFLHNDPKEIGYQFLFYPTPKEAHDIQFSYEVVKAPLESGDEPLGGDVHSQTVLEACYAAAEMQMEETVGVHQTAFMERLKVSIDQDRRNYPTHMGYNGNLGTADYPFHYYRHGLVSITHENQP